MTSARSWCCVAVALAFTLTTACSGSSTADDETPRDAGGTSSAGTPSNNAPTGGTSSDSVSAGGTSSAGTSNSETAGTPSSSDTSNAGAAGASAEPPYANVTAVAVSGDAGSYTFNVTIESADIDCSQYADWWEVLTTDGTLVYRRILDHSHTDANGTSDPNAPGNTFTRSGGPVSVEENDVVLVRAHMSVGGYNGAVMRGSVAAGFTEAPDIGSDFAIDVETEAPLPTDCEF